MYSLKRSAHVELISVYTNRTTPLSGPALAKSSSVPYPTSITLTSMPPGGVGGDQPVDFKRMGNFAGPSNSSRVSPSLQVVVSVYFSVWTSTFAARKAATAHSTALAISGEPVTRPPISSVRRRRFSSIGDCPMTMGKSFAATCAQLEASVVEQPAAGFCAGVSGFLSGGSCASEDRQEVKKYRRKEPMKRNLRCMPRSGMIDFAAAKRSGTTAGGL